MSDASQTDRKAFILRIRPSGKNRIPEALECDQLIIGWSCAPGLLDESLGWEGFREIVHERCYGGNASLQRAGSGAGNMWRFIREMIRGDLVVVPHDSNFYVAEVAGDAFFDESKTDDDTAYRRPAKWLNNKKPIPRGHAKSALFARMHARQTCVWAGDLVQEIEGCLDSAKQGTTPSFEEALVRRLAASAHSELLKGQMNPRAFEHLISTLFEKLGAETEVIPRRSDIGIDVVAKFRIGGLIPVTIGIQAKYWKEKPALGEEVVDQLVRGIEDYPDDIDYGMVITTGTIGADAEDAANVYTGEKGVPIELVDGKRFSRMLVENGVLLT